MKFFYNASDLQLKNSKKFHAFDFEIYKIQCVRFSVEKNYNAFYFEMKFLKRARSKNQVLDQIISWQRRILHFSGFFKKHEFEIKFLQRVRFWKKFF